MNDETVPNSGPSRNLGRILIYDDEEEIVDIFKEILRHQNIEVKASTDPRNVLNDIKEFSPHAIFSDLSMPHLSGMDLLKLVKKTFPDLPVVLISGYINKEILMEAIKHGVFRVIEKPFDIQKILDGLRNR